MAGAFRPNARDNYPVDCGTHEGIAIASRSDTPVIVGVGVGVGDGVGDGIDAGGSGALMSFPLDVSITTPRNLLD